MESKTYTEAEQLVRLKNALSSTIQMFRDGIINCADDPKISSLVLHPKIKEELLDESRLYDDVDYGFDHPHSFRVHLNDNKSKWLIKRSLYNNDKNIYYVDFDNQRCCILDESYTWFEFSWMYDGLVSLV